MSSSKNDTELAQQYQQKTDKQHILDNPDTYIGSVENVDANLWVYNEPACLPLISSSSPLKSLILSNMSQLVRQLVKRIKLVLS